MRTSSWSVLALPAALVLTLAACDGSKSPTDGVKDATGKLADAAKDLGNKGVEAAKDLGSQGWDSVKDAASKLTDQAGAATWADKAVESVKSQVAALKAKANDAPAAVKPQIDALMAQIEDQVSSLGVKAKELKGAGPDAWKKLVDESKPMLEKVHALIAQVKEKLAG